MASLSAEQIAARRTFAKVAASATPQILSNNPNDSTGSHTPILQSPRNDIITPAIPRNLVPNMLTEAPQTLPQNGLETTPVLITQGLSGALDESNTQLSSSDDSVKPPSLDGKSVASVTTFAMDEKESLRPDDSASVKAIEDEDIYSPPGSAAIGSRLGSETGARAFRDQLQEITSRGPALRQSRPTSRPDSAANAPAGVLYVPPPIDGSAPMPGYIPPPSAVTGKPEDLLPDPKLLDALNSPRDRIWVLKLEQDIIDFVTHSKEPTIDLPQCNSFYRMLAHKLADYYSLGHAVDGSISAVRLFKTPTCRIAPPLSAFNTPTTMTSTPPPTAPQMKILRRGGEAPLNGLSKASSEGGDSADSEKNKAILTREQREQRYEEARLRIMGSAKPAEDTSSIKDKDESRSSSATGKKKTKKQRSNSDDDFEARSAYSTFTTSQGGAAEGGAAMYYPAFPGGTPGMYGAPAGYAPQNSYNAVYGSMAPAQVAPYPWLQQGYSGYNDPANQPQPNANDLAADFQAMTFQGQSGPTPPPPSQAAPYGYPAPQPQQQQQQQHPSWPQPYQAGYPGSPGYPGQFASRPASSASHGSATHGYPYGMPSNQIHMQDAYMGYPNQAMAGFNRAPFNPQSQAFIPGYQPHYGAPMSSHNAMAFGGSFAGPPPLQRQSSTQSQASSYTGRANQDTSRPTHPLPQPVFSPHVPMPFQNSQRQPGTPNRTNGNMLAEKAGSVSSGIATPSSIAKWGTPASLPAKPPPPAAGDSFDMSRLSQGQRSGASFAPGGAGRLPGVGGQNFHALPAMVSLRGGTPQRNGQ